MTEKTEGAIKNGQSRDKGQSRMDNLENLTQWW